VLRGKYFKLIILTLLTNVSNYLTKNALTSQHHCKNAAVRRRALIIMETLVFSNTPNYISYIDTKVQPFSFVFHLAIDVIRVDQLRVIISQSLTPIIRDRSTSW